MAKSSGTRRERAAWMAGEWWAQKLQKGDPELFAAAVARRVLDELRRGTEPVHLLCDRDPCGIIYDALIEIGTENLSEGNSAKGVLPIKHELLVYSNCLYPKEGAGNSMPPIEIPPRGGDAYSNWPPREDVFAGYLPPEYDPHEP